MCVFGWGVGGGVDGAAAAAAVLVEFTMLSSCPSLRTDVAQGCGILMIFP